MSRAHARQGTVVEWGPHVAWSKVSHQVYPRAFKAAVFTLLLCHNRKSSVFSSLPRDVLLVIFRLLAEHFNANPFLEMPPHPDPESLVKKEGEDEDEANVGMF